MKLGKLPPVPDHRDLAYEAYVAHLGTLTHPSSDTDNLTRVSKWGMLANDKYGDCVWAGAGHETMLWNVIAGKAIAISDKNVVSDYSAVTGFNPSDPSTDQGTVVREALKYRQHTGIVDAQGRRHKIAAYMALEPGNRAHIKEAVYLFDGVGIGFSFPDSAFAQFDQGKPWTVVAGAKIEGGHYVPVIGYTSRSLYVVTWGKVQRMSWDFFATYCTAAEHRALTADLRWTPTGDLRVGDDLITFEEEATSPGGRRYQAAKVTAVEHEMADVLDVELSTGEVISVTPEHRWLVASGQVGARWVRTDQMKARTLRSDWRDNGGESKIATHLSRVMPTWSDRRSYDDGWLAGFLDGEAHVKPHKSVLSFSQNRGPVLDRAIGEFQRLGYAGSLSVAKPRVRTGVAVDAEPRECITVHIKGKLGDRLAILGSLRPTRLLAAVDGDRLGRMQRYEGVEVVSIRPGGRREIAKVTTSTGTMIVEGYPMHNCDEAWALLSQEFLKGGKSPEGFDLDALKTDLGALR